MYNTLHTVAKVASRPEKLILILKKLIKLRKKIRGSQLSIWTMDILTDVK